MTPKKPVNVAYSYIRWSTPEQAKGDSLRRQTEAAEAYAKQHGLTLDTELNLRDTGVSAFHGKNAEVGALAAFLRAIEEGIVEPGSVLLVEALDRISRKSANRAIVILQQIVDAGVDVVTLNDGKRYDTESMEGFDFVMAVILMIRGHEESKMKSHRLRAAWANKRTKATATRETMTKMLPTWMELDAKRKAVLVPAKARVVRQMVTMRLRGQGYMAIAGHLNRTKVPTFRWAEHWGKSVVRLILVSPALTGIYIPHTVTHKDGKLLKLPQEPIPDYYPAVIDADTYARLQQTIDAPQPRGKYAPNGATHVLAGLGKCPECGAAMTRSRSGSQQHWYLVCAKVRVGAAKHGVRVRYDAIEAALIERHEELLANMPSPDAEVAKGLDKAQVTADVLQDRVAALVDQLERHPSDALAKRVADLETALVAAQDDLADWADKAAATDTKALRLRTRNLTRALTKPSDTAPINAALRELVTQVIVDYRTGYLVFMWRSGGESSILFMWPKAA